MNKQSTTAAEASTWPGAFGVYKQSRDAVRANLGTFIGLWVLSFAASFVIGSIFGRIFEHSFAQMITQMVSLVVSTYFTLALTQTILVSTKEEHISLQTALSFAWSPLLWKLLLLELLISITVIGGLILLIVPGIIFGMRLMLAPYYLIDKNLDVIEAYKASWRATKGSLGKILGMVGVVILMLLPSLTIVGIILTAYWLVMYSAAAGFLYRYVSKRQKAEKSQKQ
jgi:hypothetical protein